MLRAVREKIVQACPDVTEEHCQCCGWKTCDRSTTGCPWYVGRTIGIAEVLRAYRNVHGIISKMLLVNDDGWFVLGLLPPKKKIQWNLSDDNLDHQSPETIAFLHGLLVKS